MKTDWEGKTCKGRQSVFITNNKNSLEPRFKVLFSYEPFNSALKLWPIFDNSQFPENCHPIFSINFCLGNNETFPIRHFPSCLVSAARPSLPPAGDRQVSDRSGLGVKVTSPAGTCPHIRDITYHRHRSVSTCLAIQISHCVHPRQGHEVLLDLVRVWRWLSQYARSSF